MKNNIKYIYKGFVYVIPLIIGAFIGLKSREWLLINVKDTFFANVCFIIIILLTYSFWGSILLTFSYLWTIYNERKNK